MKSRWFRLIGHEPIFDNSNLRALLPAQKQKVEQWSWRWDRRASRDSASQEVAPRFTSRLSHSEHRYLSMFRMDLLFPVRAFARFRERPDYGAATSLSSWPSNSSTTGFTLAPTMGKASTGWTASRSFAISGRRASPTAFC